MPPKAKPRATKIVLAISVKKAKPLPKHLGYWPREETVYPKVAVDREHGFVVFQGWTTVPDKDCAFEPRFLADVIVAWNETYPKSKAVWEYRFRSWPKEDKLRGIVFFRGDRIIAHTVKASDPTGIRPKEIAPKKKTKR